MRTVEQFGHPAIQLWQVSKHFGRTVAVQDLNLTIDRGQIVGFLGPNGAGKTTTLRLMTGFLRPTTGQVQLLGFDMDDRRYARAARARLGFVPDVAAIDPALTGKQLLDELASLHSHQPIDRSSLIDALQLRQADLERPLKRLSRGTRQKINIVQGLQHRPDLLILDEPTEGLDPLTRQALFSLLTNAHRHGATIFFSSHTLGDVEAICDRVALIRDGRLTAVDRIDTLQAGMQRRVRVLLARTDIIGIEALRATPGVRQLERTEFEVTLLSTDIPALLKTLAQLPVVDVVIEAPSLESVFLQHYVRDTDHDERGLPG